ncbi:transcriptional regulator, Crp/Fnr family [Kribbella flavida DSM 17836]|uniref:Transcriptional regulator, Crp/Fnr family n=1 Tax=Kribbella flavida (strain DSM 17836 / JCM 10339 / NBRC 14399) TaxID=479435 RepID=D2PSQ0_KRIFD|nr:Crp/Fnr family transcriptional regulator [Kribbella flavida]ADB33188.1 transcriptional regulator, Crp/Fnr family [Kribbella flavida DSM 17836]
MTGRAGVPAQPGQLELGRELRELIETGELAAVLDRLPARAMVRSPGSIEETVCLIRRGVVKQSRAAAGGRHCVIALHGPGDVYGDVRLEPGLWQDALVAVQPVQLWRIRAGDFQAALRDGALQAAYFDTLAGRLVEQQQVISDLVTLDSRHRLAATLARTAARLGAAGPGGVCLDVRLTHEELGAIVGTTRSRISRFLREFRECGLVHRRDGALVFPDLGRLTEFATTDPALEARRLIAS